MSDESAAVSVSPEEPRPTRDQVAQAMYDSGLPAKGSLLYDAADAILALPVVSRALQITACPVGGVEWCTTHLGVRNEDEELCDMADLDVADCVLHEMFYDAGRAVGVVDPTVQS